MTDPTHSEPPKLPLHYSQAPSAQTANGWAIASAIVAFCGCIPIIPGLAAIFLGIVGIRKSRENLNGSGRGLAVVGTLLGAISFLVWSFYAGLLIYGYIESKPAEAVAKQFLQDVDSGNISGAMSISLFNQSQLQPGHDKMIALRGLQSINITSFKVTTRNGHVEMNLGGTASFVRGTGICTFVLIKVNGAYKVTTYWVQ
jgi:hypothetical protein